MTYDIFNGFVDTANWLDLHPNDSKRFDEALKKALKSESFDPEEMKAHIAARLKAMGKLESVFGPRLDRITKDAWAIKRYLQNTK